MPVSSGLNSAHQLKVDKESRLGSIAGKDMCPELTGHRTANSGEGLSFGVIDRPHQDMGGQKASCSNTFV